jgi:ABC-type nitrate/sulfonate/bicarbonate transport system substrate-binding protein
MRRHWKTDSNRVCWETAGGVDRLESSGSPPLDTGKLIQANLTGCSRKTIIPKEITLNLWGAPMNKYSIILLLWVIAIAGCGSSDRSQSSSSPDGGAAPEFVLAWSEYPSWSVFGVAEEVGLIDGSSGGLGDLEKKWNVDIVLKGVDYDTCIQLYGSNAADAVCITNMDILGPAADRASVAILPTSTSVGADACIAVGIEDLEQLKGKTTRGLERSVSQYAFERILSKRGLDPKEFPFVNMDPGAAATAMQTGDSSVESIMVWNPFVMETLNKVEGSRRLFDSSEIPQEIIDMVVVGKESLEREGGARFARCILEAFYAINDRMADPSTSDETLVAIGAKFSNLQLEDMKQVVEQTRFYKTPAEGLSLMKNDQFRQVTMPAVADFCVSQEMFTESPSIGFDSGEAQLEFDSSYLQALVDGIDP